MDVIIVVGASRLKIYPQIPEDLFQELRQKLRFHPSGYQYSPKFKNHIWDGWINLLYKNQTAPAGCYRIIKNFLKKNDCNVTVKFENNFLPKGDGKVYKHNPLDFQKQCADIAVKNRMGIISAPVRSGKTLIIAMIISKIDYYPVWVVTYGSDLVIQTREEISDFLKKDVGYLTEGEFKNEDIIVTSYQALTRIFSDKKVKAKKTIERNEKILKSIEKTKVLIMDECHYALSQKSVRFIKQFVDRGYTIGLSGTPKPDGVSKTELESKLGPVLITIPFKKLIEIGRIAQPYIYLYHLHLNWYQFDLSDYTDIYEINIVQNYYRNKFIATLVNKLKEKNKTSFVMVAKKRHGRLLNALIPNSTYVYGDISTSTRKILYNKLNDGSLNCIIATVGKVGLNIPQLDAMINAEGYYSSVSTIQKMRSLTSAEGKEAGIIIDFMDKGKDLMDHSIARYNKYNSLDGFIVKEKKISKNFFDNKEKNET